MEVPSGGPSLQMSVVKRNGEFNAIVLGSSIGCGEATTYANIFVDELRRAVKGICGEDASAPTTKMAVGVGRLCSCIGKRSSLEASIEIVLQHMSVCMSRRTWKLIGMISSVWRSVWTPSLGMLWEEVRPRSVTESGFQL